MTDVKEHGGVVRNQLPAVLWALLIFVSSSIPSRDFPSVQIPHIDKVVHFIYYFIFAFLTARALSLQSRFPDLSRFSLILSALLATAYGVTDEIHQLFVAGRSADPQDLLTDFMGALVCVAVLWIWRRIRAKDGQS